MSPYTAKGDKGFYDFLIQEYKWPFQGWNFAHITRTGRMLDGPLSWSYGSIVMNHIRESKSLLDLGTGGGELLASLRPLPALTRATESYHPNVAVARRKLEPHGVKVLETQEGAALPFPDGTFELVIDRHESYTPSEVLRVLNPGGRFITQQVGWRNDDEIKTLLKAKRLRTPRWDLRIARSQLSKAGFSIILCKEEFPWRRFYDVGALVYYLKAAPWVIPDFTPRKYFASLAKLNSRIQREGYIEDRNSRFIIVAQKPAS